MNARLECKEAGTHVMWPLGVICPSCKTSSGTALHFDAICARCEDRFRVAPELRDWPDYLSPLLCNDCEDHAVLCGCKDREHLISNPL